MIWYWGQMKRWVRPRAVFYQSQVGFGQEYFVLLTEFCEIISDGFLSFRVLYWFSFLFLRLIKLAFLTRAKPSDRCRVFLWKTDGILFLNINKLPYVIVLDWHHGNFEEFSPLLFLSLSFIDRFLFQPIHLPTNHLDQYNHLWLPIYTSSHLILICLFPHGFFFSIFL